MDVWILEKEIVMDHETEVTVYASEHEALLAAMDEAKVEIDNNWNTSDSDVEAESIRFDDLRAKDQLIDALDVYNDMENEFEDEAVLLRVYDRQVQGNLSAAPTTHKAATGYTTAIAGATCRGSCKQWNEYAYADQADGTYVCYQCRIFGSKP